MTTHARPYPPSTNQAGIFSWVKSGTGNLIVEAVAGSGKSTTIVWALEFIPPHQTVLFLAFNKSIADALKAQVPSNVNASTFHSLGFSALKRMANTKPLRVDQWKVSNIMRDMSVNLKWYGKFVGQLVSFAKGALALGALEDCTIATLMQIANRQEMYLDEEEGASVDDAVKIAQKVITTSALDLTAVDFDDMLYMPLVRNAPFSRYDWVFVDEAQDTNAVQREIVKRCLKPSGRLVLVGDGSQSIYGFRGADSEALSVLQKTFSCSTLPLDVSWRCAKSIVKAAQQYQTV